MLFVYDIRFHFLKKRKKHHLYYIKMLIPEEPENHMTWKKKMVGSEEQKTLFHRKTRLKSHRLPLPKILSG